MARRTFFSFHFAVDIHRASVVRHSQMTQEESGFFDASLWEEAKTKGTPALQKLIDGALERTTVTVVLIGSDTSDRDWVNYEIRKSIERGNGLVGVRVHQIKDMKQQVTRSGANPLDDHKVPLADGTSKVASSVYKTYDYTTDNGYGNLGKWIEEAAKLAGK